MYKWMTEAYINMMICYKPCNSNQSQNTNKLHKHGLYTHQIHITKKPVMPSPVKRTCVEMTSETAFYNPCIPVCLKKTAQTCTS